MRCTLKNPQVTGAIREFLAENNLSQTDLAKKTGLSVQYINDLYLGKSGSRIGANTERKLARAIGKKFFTN
jgi:transcriptional regulator with XRE-family HTH domain